MKIELTGPYSLIYRSGYLRVENSTGRRRLDLYNSESDRTTITYAKYIMSLKLNRTISPDEEVDHIDEDCTNDIVENLQLLDRITHAKKSASKGRTGIILTCANCSLEFFRELRLYHAQN